LRSPSTKSVSCSAGFEYDLSISRKRLFLGKPSALIAAVFIARHPRDYFPKRTVASAAVRRRKYDIQCAPRATLSGTSGTRCKSAVKSRSVSRPGRPSGFDKWFTAVDSTPFRKILRCTERARHIY